MLQLYGLFVNVTPLRQSEGNCCHCTLRKFECDVSEFRSNPWNDFFPHEKSAAVVIWLYFRRNISLSFLFSPNNIDCISFRILSGFAWQIQKQIHNNKCDMFIRNLFCLACPQNTYQPITGDGKCIPCQLGGVTYTEAAASCVCAPGFTPLQNGSCAGNFSWWFWKKVFFPSAFCYAASLTRELYLLA